MHVHRVEEMHVEREQSLSIHLDSGAAVCPFLFMGCQSMWIMH